MIKKFLILLLACLTVACRNPFLTWLSGENLECRDGEEVFSETGEVAAAVVQVCLELPFKDVSITSTRLEKSLELSVSHAYERYEWVMGQKVLSREQVCVIDFAELPYDLYPVELYAVKNGMVYSGVKYIDWKDNVLSVVSERTILPSIKKSEFCNVELMVVNRVDGSEEVFLFDSGTILENQKLMFADGYYIFSVTVQKGSLCFSGQTEADLQKGNNRISLPLQLNNSSSENGSFILKAFFPDECSIDDVTVNFYKKNADGYEVIDKKKLSEKQLNLQENDNNKIFLEYNQQKLSPGVYYVDVETLARNYRNQAAYKAYVYILPETASSRTVEISQFYNIYSLNYELNNGFFIGEELTSRVTVLDSFTLPQKEEVFRPGYSFEGWFLDSACTLPAQELWEPGEIEGSMVFYGSWKEAPGNNIVIPGAGLLSGRQVTVGQEGSELIIKAPALNDSACYFFDVYDSTGKLCAIENKTVEYRDNFIEARLEINFIPENDYLIETKVFNKSLKNDNNIVTKQFWEKQVLRAMSN